MDNPIDHYWKIRLAGLKGALEANNFETYIANNAAQAKDLILNHVLPKINPKSVSWGGSLTFA